MEDYRLTDKDLLAYARKSDKQLRSLAESSDKKTLRESVSVMKSVIADYYSLERELTDRFTKYGSSIAACIANTLEIIVKLESEQKDEEAQQTVQVQLLPLLRHFENDLFLWLDIFPNQNSMWEYCCRNVSELIQIRSDLPELLEKEYRYDVTIAIPAYNKLFYTKMAVESIFRHTDFQNYKIELILIDNGSTDGTSEYFATIPEAKCIHLIRPLGYPATALGALAAKGRYYVHFANDIIATEGWLENLQRCIRSDPDIGMVVPVCNHMSSGQSIAVSYRNPAEDLSELEEFSRGYNYSDPLRWQERIRLLPCMSIMPAVVAAATPNDSLFHFGEFADDDMSTRLRRAGFRQIFAADTFVHHFGSVTSKDAQRQHQSLQTSRLLFRQKWGVDAWSSLDWGQNIAYRIVSSLVDQNKGILWIDPQFCALPVQVRDICRKQQITLEKGCGIVTDPRYFMDAMGVLRQVQCNSLPVCLELLQGKEFSAAVFRTDIAEYLDGNGSLSDLLMQVSKVITPGGKVYFSSRNKQLFGSFEQMYQDTMTDLYCEYEIPSKSLVPDDVEVAAKSAGYLVEAIPWEKTLSPQLCSVLKKLSGVKESIEYVSRYLYVLTRNN